MSSLYFAASNGGYVKKTTEGIPSRSTGREIPVHVRVNEYMNNKPAQEERIMIKQVDEKAEQIELQQSLRQINIAVHKDINSALVKSAHQLEKQLDEPLNGKEEMRRSLIKMKQYSSKDTSASQLDPNDREKLKVSIIESQLGKNQDYEDVFEKSEIQREIQKEKTLRRNLENSYLNLLGKLRKYNEGSNKSTELNNSDWTSKNRRLGQTSIFHPTNKTLEQEIKKNKHKKQRKHSECSVQSSRSVKECKSNPQEEKAMSQRTQNIYEQQLQRQREFQSDLLQEIKNANQRINELENSLLKRQIRLQKLLRQNKNRQNSGQKYIENSFSGKSLKIQGNQDLKQQIHYIFTIFLMFLIIVVISKNKEK